MVHITLSYGVEDYDKWKSGFNAHSETRKAAGCLSTTIYVSPDDRNSLNIVFEWDSKENFVKYSSNPELKEAMAKSGLTSSPTIKFWDLQTE
jgi:quinol monooxygenase YgiN